MQYIFFLQSDVYKMIYTNKTKYNLVYVLVISNNAKIKMFNKNNYTYYSNSILQSNIYLLYLNH